MAQSMLQDFKLVLKDMSKEDKYTMMMGIFAIIAIAIATFAYAEKRKVEEAQWTHFLITHEVLCNGRDITDGAIEYDYYGNMVYRDLDNSIKICAEPFVEVHEISVN